MKLVEKKKEVKYNKDFGQLQIKQNRKSNLYGWKGKTKKVDIG
jgi:hypothetical protein